ncbi:hypothetical protein NE857_04245 [Nocardiopsis exhalans]|uniref:Uncharacterized protein n=1 Tax=Nocardiopsis exhalans TaxID=163604 RepID=A0ABY5DA42_9ACTN|nr:hypothetical protein [Nocardiopsis exhalans]USY20872.1 hypothetical protein NE857_04245 [Nocardiopsis exhalans]
MTDLITVWQRSTVAELSWTASAGPSGIPVVPLMWRDSPCAALPYSMAETALSLRGLRVAFSVSDADAGGRTAVVGSGPVEVVEDLEGNEFLEHMAEQEALKHPPTRLRTDSLMGRRENWWWVPRVLVSLPVVEEQRELHPRTRSGDALLVRDRAGRPEVDVVTAQDWSDETAESITLWSRGGGLLEGAREPVFVFSHQYSPDFERWERWSRSGHLTGDSLLVNEVEGGPTGETPSGPLSPYTLLERFTNHRALARTCRAAIRRAESREAS